jgi:hypothetical protein
MKFTIWFLCIVFPVMFIWMGNLPIAAVLTMFLYGIAMGIRWLFIKAEDVKRKRAIESRVTKLN